MDHLLHEQVLGRFSSCHTGDVNLLAKPFRGHVIVSWLYERDRAKADIEFQRATKLNPGYVLAHHWRGLFLGEMARFDEAAGEMERAIELDPTSPPNAQPPDDSVASQPIF